MLESQLNPSLFQILALVTFVLALIHSFSCSFIHKFALKHPELSLKRRILMVLSEVELVFAFWVIPLMIALFTTQSTRDALSSLRHLSFNEPLFVFLIMLASATKPVLKTAEFITHVFTELLPLPPYLEPYFVICGIIPLLGSFITEPAAMTVCALLLHQHFLAHPVSTRFRYLSLAVIFVNVSIGGTLTHYAAPPVIMVAKPWGWDSAWMFSHIGYKAIIACFLNAGLASFILRKEIKPLPFKRSLVLHSPSWLVLLHLTLLTAIILAAHHPLVLALLFVALLILVNQTKHHQSPLKLKESVLVGVFLAGIVVIGQPQQWWLTPVIASLSPLSLNLSATGLTAITDNAALTYLGSLVPSLSPEHQYALMSGAVTGGGLTIIANAPNPAGAQITKASFPGGDIHPARLFSAAVIPTLIAWICLWTLPALRF